MCHTKIPIYNIFPHKVVTLLKKKILKKNLDFMNGEQVLVVLTMSDKNLVENITLKG